MSGWLRRLVLWDGLLPLATWGVPRAVLWLFPAERWPIEVLGVGLPILAFMCRFFAGLAAVRALPIGSLALAARTVLLFLGILLLCIIDTAMILRLVMPPGAFLNPGDLIVLAVLYGAYVATMALALAPVGRRASRHAAGTLSARGRS